MLTAILLMAERLLGGSYEPEDVAAAVVFVATLPPRAVVSEILIEPRVRTTPLPSPAGV